MVKVVRLYLEREESENNERCKGAEQRNGSWRGRGGRHGMASHLLSCPSPLSSLLVSCH